jgi:hypothetical protein
MKILYFQLQKRRKAPGRNEQNLTASWTLWCYKKSRLYVKKECPSLKNILQDLEKDNIFHCSKEFLQKKIRETRSQWKKCPMNRRLPTESCVSKLVKNWHTVALLCDKESKRTGQKAED